MPNYTYSYKRPSVSGKMREKHGPGAKASDQTGENVKKLGQNKRYWITQRYPSGNLFWEPSYNVSRRITKKSQKKSTKKRRNITKKKQKTSSKKSATKKKTQKKSIAKKKTTKKSSAKKKTQKKSSAKKKTSRKKSATTKTNPKKSTTKKTTKTQPCLNGSGRWTPGGNHVSPKFKGYCARNEEIGVRMKGKNNKLYTVTERSNGSRYWKA
jgi:hypothetical protein